MATILRERRDVLLARIAFEAVWQRDLRTDALEWDGNLESIFGYRRDEVGHHIGWWRQHVHPDDLERVEAVTASALNSAASGWVNEYRFRRKDGSWAWVASRCVIERDGDGRAVSAIGAMIDITPLKDAETRLRLFTQQIPARACVTDRELRVVWDAGRAFPDSPSAVGKTVPELFATSPDYDRVLDGCARALAGESMKLQIDDGTTAAQLQLEPFRDPAGNVIGVVGIAFDITDRVRSEEQVRAGQRLMSQVLELLPVGVIVMNGTGDILLSNPASGCIWGGMVVSGEERWKKSEGFHRGSGEQIAEGEWASQRALQKGETTRDELIDIHSFDGVVKTIKNYAAPLRDAKGAITGAVVVNEDVTERVQAEEALRKTERLLVDAEKLGLTGSWEQDLVTGEIFNTDANRRLFFGDDEGKGPRIEDYFEALHPDDRDRVRESREALHAGTGSGDIEFRVIWPDGSVHWIFGRATIVRDASGRPLRAYGTNADITERRRAEAELARRAQQLETLSARLLQSQDQERRRIARELHDTTAQNLGALRMDLAMVKRSLASMNPEASKAIEESMALTERTIAEIRTLSYLLHPPMIEEAGLLPSLRWYANGFQERSGIAVALELPEAIGRLPVETETAVFRIVQEALTNIQRHSGSAIAKIRIERDPGILRLHICDEGRGLPPALRGDERMLAAAGVGMASMRERARELGGSMRARSNGGGTEIEVRLPIAEG
ncbi:MAG TPA: PAS domain-containing protein [Thermoanaerobaculia bacterium]|nr:PAS domain-containing protein [Thermoanaerobaculia bacterium]